MAVLIGSARIDENGKAHGGAAGDQTGKEVSTQKWYRYEKKGQIVPWRVIRCTDPEKAEKIAVAMEHACANKDIGYDQYQRDSLRTNVAPFGYDPAKTTKPVETDCSALVRTCVAYALGWDMIGDVIGDKRFTTANMCKYLLMSKEFTEMVGAEYTDTDANLKRGDILCTAVQAHTVVALSNGSKVKPAPQPTPQPSPIVKTTIRKGASGELVQMLQRALLRWDSSALPKYGADADFGTETLNAVKRFQTAHGLEADGIVGPKTWAALDAYADAVRMVEITGGTVNVRSGAGTSFGKITTVHRGDVLEVLGEADVDGVKWIHIPAGWVSGNYCREV